MKLWTFFKGNILLLSLMNNLKPLSKNFKKYVVLVWLSIRREICLFSIAQIMHLKKTLYDSFSGTAIFGDVWDVDIGLLPAVIVIALCPNSATLWWSCNELTF